MTARPLALDAPAAVPPPRRSLLYRGLVNQIVCLVVSVPFWLLSYRRSDYGVVLLYSFAIGNLIWLFIDGGRQLTVRLLGPRVADKSHWPGWGSMSLTILIGSVAGYSLGTSLVDRLLGLQSPSLFTNLSPGLITLLVAGAATYFFYSRERLHTEMAAAEAARRLAVENQLKLLESQLEPHMLFNTLANLRVLIGIDPPKAQAMLDRLISFLRATLNASRNGAHPLSAEFDRLADYLALMAIRMGPRLVVDFDLPADLRDTAVPPLLLQPLVENAIKHGLEPKLEGGRIHVQARREGGQLVLTVRDTGVGLAAAANAATPPSSDTRYGTAHVRERLNALYGERASFALAAAPGAEGGTLATLTLPLPAPAQAPDTPATTEPSPCPPR
ncbi:sensor histidine kinase [Aquabacterium sp.]|uniref:sensor histidine kinase n=1 Tax=Aquabacterium sp. TaxID=1872578 RepID=UPI002D04BF58|nr:histidine kinase [Aquabacterium sp.]HSW06391.1 histidine kinase [Aquabacterium sp.]